MVPSQNNHFFIHKINTIQYTHKKKEYKFPQTAINVIPRKIYFILFYPINLPTKNALNNFFFFLVDEKKKIYVHNTSAKQWMTAASKNRNGKVTELHVQGLYHTLHTTHRRRCAIISYLHSLCIHAIAYGEKSTDEDALALTQTARVQDANGIVKLFHSLQRTKCSLCVHVVQSHHICRQTHTYRRARGFEHTRTPHTHSHTNSRRIAKQRDQQQTEILFEVVQRTETILEHICFCCSREIFRILKLRNRMCLSVVR